MRILIIDNLAVASSRRDLYRLLAKQIGEPIHLLVPKTWREQGLIAHCEEETDDNLKIYTSSILFGYRHQRVIYKKLKRIIIETKPDIIFINSEPENFNTFHLVLIVKKYFPAIKIACATWRNIDYRYNPYPYKFGWINRMIETYTKKKIDICFAYSHTAESLMRELANWEVVYTPPPINIEDFQFKPKLTDSKSDTFVVGYLGRISYEKGVDILMRAIALTDKNIHCMIVGNGPEKEKLKVLAEELVISERVKWHNAVEYKNIPSFMKSFDVLVLPSRTTEKWKEQFGRVLIEAMACGVPVIGSNSGEIPNVIGENGVLFEENNPEKLAEAIKFLRDNFDIRNRMVFQARNFIELEYNYEKSVHLIISGLGK